MTPHVHRLRVYYEDTDAGGIVYHANFLKFAERARTEMLREAGLGHRRLGEEHGGQFAVVRCAVRFRAPARLDDLVRVETTLMKAGGARLELRQTVLLEGLTLADLEVELAFVGPDLRPRRLPRALLDAMIEASGRRATA